MKKILQLNKIHRQLQACKRCPNMCGTPVHGPAMQTQIMVIGQAPGVHESSIGQPFAYTAGKTLFKWLYQATGFDEMYIRKHIYFSAVARCFPGKATKGSGDREPTINEIENCREYLASEVQTIKPKVIIAVGKLAIREVLGGDVYTKETRLQDVVGKRFTVKYHNVSATVIPLPHPSGVSSWPHRMPGKMLLGVALGLIKESFIKIASSSS